MAYHDYLRRSPLPVQVSPSPAESARFGMSVGRLILGKWATTEAAEIRRLIAAAGHDLTIVRYPATWVGLAAGLLERDLVSWQADTLLYFEKGLPEVAEMSAREDLRLTPMSMDRGLLFEAVIRDIFTAYGNHYLANPCLSPDTALDGYVEWALDSTTDDNAAAFVLVSAGDDRPLAMCTLDLREEVAEIGLAGVVTDARGRGVYRKLLDEVESWLVRQGRRSVVISTQAGNPAPVRAWINRGFQYAFGVNTMHVMPRAAFAHLRPPVDDVTRQPDGPHDG